MRLVTFTTYGQTTRVKHLSILGSEKTLCGVAIKFKAPNDKKSRRTEACVACARRITGAASVRRIREGDL